MKKYILLLRVKQWIKNLFVFVPAFFGGALTLTNLFDLAIAFLSFCIIASAIYIVNDYNDIEEDKLHPKKKHRPLASGLVSNKVALGIALIFVVLAFAISYYLLPINFLLVIALYFLLNLFYSFALKQIAIVDLLIVSLGFVLRIIAGAEVVEVDVSFWLLLMTFLFSMFIVLGKRRDDYKDGYEKAIKVRPVNRHYNLKFLNYSIVIFSSLMTVCYIMYTYSSEYFLQKIYLALASSILVLMGLMRYLQVVFVEEGGGSPTEFAFKDRFIQITLLIWIGIFFYLIYIA